MERSTNPWRTLFVGLALSLIAVAVLVLLVRALPPDASGLFIAVLVLLAAALAIAYRLTVFHQQSLVGWLLACALVPEYVLLTQILHPKALDGWAAVAHFFAMFYGIAAASVGAGLGLFVKRRRRSDT